MATDQEAYDAYCAGMHRDQEREEDREDAREDAREDGPITWHDMMAGRLRTAIEFCATCGGWISIGPTYQTRPYETDHVTVVVRLKGDEAGHGYDTTGGCKCQPLPAGQLSAKLRREERDTDGLRYPARQLVADGGYRR